jgi:catechol 2,3-dioxygenase
VHPPDRLLTTQLFVTIIVADNRDLDEVGMDTKVEQPAFVAIDPATAVGWTALTVADLERSLRFYTEVLGFQRLGGGADSAVLGAGAVPLLALVEQPGARPKPQRATGLYHFAILVPTRADLGRSLRHLAEAGWGLDGVADHLVSEALYLHDPDGNGIEIYRDRPRAEWRYQNGQVAMASDPLDLNALVAEGDHDERPWTGLPAGTTIGHMHLQVSDIAQARAFYHELLGFDIVALWPGALFVSAGGYHHHLGLNTWASRNGPQPPDGSAGLRGYAVTLPTAEAIAPVVERLRVAGIAVEELPQGAVFADPWNNRIILTVAGATTAALSAVGI